MPETPKLNVDTGGQTGTPQVDNFSKELSDFILDEKLTNKEQISNFLVSNPNLKVGFEEFLKTANNVQKLKCKKELKNCSTEEEIKSIIVENIPEGYRIGNNDIVENVEISEDLVGDDILLRVTEQSDQKTEQAKTDTEQAKTDTEQAKTDTEQADLMKAKMNLLIKERDDLFKSHPDQKKAKKLDEDTRKEAERVKQQLPEEIKNQLKGKGYDENFINDYILLRVTANEVKKDTSFDRNAVAQFESKVNELGTLDIILKNIDNACNTPDTSLDSFSSENISQTRTELFHPEIGNDSLIQAKKSNLESRNYSGMLPEMGNEEMFEKYGQFLQGDLKKYWDEYKNNYLGFINYYHDVSGKKSQGQILTKEEEEFLKLPSMIRGIKKEMDNNTKNMIEELCIISQIKGMYMCMGKGENFNLNKANEIESENGVLTLRGHIDGVKFAIRQDTTKESPLQTSSKLARSLDGKTFSIDGNDNFVDSNFILPTQNEIFDAIIKTITLSNPIENFNSPDDYLQSLQTNIMGNMEKKYENTKYVHHYMQGQVKGEKIVDNTLGLIGKKSPSINSDETLMKSINQENNKDLYDFMKILKFNIDNSTESEKDNLDKCITKILEITDSYQDTNGIEPKDLFKYPPIIENYLKNSAWLNGGNENSRLGLLADLFKYYSEKSQDTRSNSEGNDSQPSKMIINDLYRDLFDSSNSESLVSQGRTVIQENKGADDYLDVALAGFPPSPEAPSPSLG